MGLLEEWLKANGEKPCEQGSEEASRSKQPAVNGGPITNKGP
jgi:hypothetical protein